MWNEVSESLPSEIGRLVKLRALDCRHTFLHSELPSEIVMLKELAVLVMSCVSLTEPIVLSVIGGVLLGRLCLLLDSYPAHATLGRVVRLRIHKIIQ